MFNPSKKMVSLVLVIAMLFSTVSTAAAAEIETEVATATEVVETVDVEAAPEVEIEIGTETEGELETPSAEAETDEEVATEVAGDTEVEVDVGTEASDEFVAAGVWSDADPYFTGEVFDEVADDATWMPALWSMGERAAYPTYEEAYQAMIALQDEYPEGMKWTNFAPYGSQTESTNPEHKHGYRFQGGAIKGAQLGVGCAAFCFLVSDLVYGNIPARVVDEGDFEFEDIRVGDFLRVNSSHFVTVLRITPSGVIVAEGNYSGTVHWGRAISRDELMFSANFLVSRYPADYQETAGPEEEVASGTEGSLAWTISNKGLLTITGNGGMPNYDYSTRPSWEAAGQAIYDVEIGTGVESVGDYAFYGQADLINVSLSGTVASIGNGAFRESSLVGLTLPSSVKTVGDDAFYGCTSLTSVSISEGVQKIGERAFHSCTTLNAVDFPSSLTEIGGGAFTSCENLMQVRFMPSSGNLKIGDSLFTQCWRLQFVSLPEGITELTPGLFSSCKTVFYLYIPSTVTTLAEAGEESPFTSSFVGTIYFGGAQAQWDSMMTAMSKVPLLMQTYQVLQQALVVCEQSDPFVPAPDDPGDIVFPCANGHVGKDDGSGNCDVCGDPIGEGSVDPPVDPPAEHEHEPETDWSHDEIGHWHECLAEDCPTTENSKKDSYAGHEFGEWTVSVEATAEQAGSKYRDCAVCSYRETEEIQKLPPVDPPVDPGEGEPGESENPGEGENPPAEHKHEWAEAWTNNATNHWHECVAAGCSITANSEKDSYGAHDFGGWVVDKAANATQSGSKHRDCAICIYRATETIPATGGSSGSGGNTGGSSGSGGTSGGNTGNSGGNSGSGSSGSGSPGSGGSGGSTKPGGTINSDKSVVTQKPDGSTDVKLTMADVLAAIERKEPFKIPMTAVQATRDIATAPTVTIDSETGGYVNVLIPVVKPSAGTVAILVGTDASTNMIKTSVATSDGVIASVPSGATIKIVDNSKTFTDVAPGNWANDAIAFASARELFSGTSATTFSPNVPMTRSMLMVVLARLDGAKTTGGETWYERGVEWAIQKGISDGSAPEANISREQLVTMLWRYCGSPSGAGNVSGYTDAGQISGYAQEAMAWAIENGIVSGFGDGRLGPQGQATRAQVAQMLMNLLKSLA